MEWCAPFAQLHQLCHPGIPVVHGDICDLSSLKEVATRVEAPFSLMSGISCQPYPTRGSMAGSTDDRSNTVPATIKACHLFQCPLLFLECVTQARTNQYVKWHLQLLAAKLGYHIHELTLRLEDVGAPEGTGGG